MGADQMTAARAFNRDRDAALRSLDQSQFERFARKWGNLLPKAWVGDACLATMHKMRLQVVDFTEEEKASSRAWLAEHGYTDDLGTSRPCPACGGIGLSQSDCPVCGAS